MSTSCTSTTLLRLPGVVAGPAVKGQSDSRDSVPDRIVPREDQRGD